jgi:hypothetical protein
MSGNRKVTAVQFMAPGLGLSKDAPAAHTQLAGREWNWVGAKYGLLTNEEELDTTNNWGDTLVIPYECFGHWW